MKENFKPILINLEDGSNGRDEKKFEDYII